MAYKKGDAKIATSGWDSATENYDDAAGKVVLPHSCDGWVIGGKLEVEQMIADLQELLATL